MKLFTKLDKELYSKLVSISDREDFLEFVYDYCESQADRKKILAYVNEGNNDRIKVLLMASQISIENGNSEGELIEEE